MRALAVGILATTLGLGTGGAQGAGEGVRSDPLALTCGETEKAAFTFWSPSWWFTEPSERPAPQGATLAPDVRMRDGAVIRGLLVKATQPGSRRKALLVLQGNVSFSDRMFATMARYGLMDPSYDTYIYDYRGYWRSGGVPRIRAMVDDAAEVVRALEAEYDEIRLYGLSLGSIVATRAIQDTPKVSAIFLDGIASRLPMMEKDCPAGVLDPVDMTDSTCRKVSLLVGAEDSFFSPDNARPFIDRMAACGNVQVTIHPDLGHAFSEGLFFRGNPSTIRADKIRAWLAAEAK